jgi:hypothetical protein
VLASVREGAGCGLLGGGAIFSAARASWSGVVDGKGVDWIRQYFVAFAWPYRPPVGGIVSASVKEGAVCGFCIWSDSISGGVCLGCC